MKPFEQQIREHAYFIWENEGRVFGQAENHWLRAERALTGAEAPLMVQPAAANLTLAPSPAQALDKTLKAKTTRARGATDKAAPQPVEKVQAKVQAKAPAKVQAKAPAKAAAKAAAKAPAARAAAKPAARAKAPRANSETSASIH